MFSVNVGNGELCELQTDFFLPGYLPIEFTRSYKSFSNYVGPLGHIWRHSLEIFLARERDGVVIDLSHGSKLSFPELGIGEYAKKDPDTLEPQTLLRTSDAYQLQRANGLSYIFMDTKAVSSPMPLYMVKDRNNNIIRFVWDDKGRLLEVVDTLGRIIEFRYDLKSRLVNVSLATTDADQINLVAYSYSASDDLESVYDPLNNTYTYGCDHHLIVQAKNRVGGNHYMEYDARRRCVSLYKEGGLSQKVFLYDEERKRTSVRNSMGYQTIYELNDQGMVMRKIDALGHVSESKLDKKGNLVAVLDSNDAAKPLSIYDPDKRQLTEISPSGAQTVFTYDDENNLVRSEDSDGCVWSFAYDERGNLISETSPMGATWKHLRDNRGYNTALIDPLDYVLRRTWVNVRTLRIEDDAGLINLIKFDAFGLPVELITGKGYSYRIHYNAKSRPTMLEYPDGTRNYYLYDGEDNFLQYTDGNNNLVSFEYSKFGRCLRYINPMGAVVKYEYDSEERLIKIRNSKGEEYCFEYDALDRVIREVGFDGTEVLLLYDHTDVPVEASSPSGIWVRVERNAAGRLSKIETSEGSTTLFLYDSHERLATIEQDGKSWNYEYDKEGRRTKEDQAGWLVEITYDLVGRYTRALKQDGEYLQFGIDQRGRTITISDAAAQRVSFRYDEHGNIIEKQLPNGLLEKLNYDKRDRLIDARLLNPTGVSLHQDSYEYDDGGRLIKRQDNGRTREYFYDKADRVLRVLEDSELVEKYDYDSTNNVTRTLQKEAIRIGEGDRLVQLGPEKIDYDKDGYMIRREAQDGEWVYEYSPNGFLTRVRDPQGKDIYYEYDPFGRRLLSRTDNIEKRFLWFLQYLLEETVVAEEQAVREKLFVYEPHSFRPLLVREQDHWFYTHIDNRGLPVNAWDEQQEKVWELKANIWGDDYGISGVALNLVPFRLLGQYKDQDTGLCYNRFRYYWPQASRFLSHDPLGVWGGINLYSSGPNALQWADPFGLQPAQLVGTVDCQTVIPCPNQNPRDAAVVGNDCPDPLPFDYPPGHPRAGQPRGGGGQRHNDCCQQMGQNLQGQGYQDVRVNQRQGVVDPATGATANVGINRPDVSGYNPVTNRTTYVELDTPQSGRGAGHAQRICDNDCDGIVQLYQFNPTDTGPC